MVVTQLSCCSLGVYEGQTRGLGLTCHIHCGYDQSESLERPCWEGRRVHSMSLHWFLLLNTFHWDWNIFVEGVDVLFNREKETFSGMWENIERKSSFAINNLDKNQFRYNYLRKKMIFVHIFIDTHNIPQVCSHFKSVLTSRPTFFNPIFMPNKILWLPWSSLQ